jgi:hypothetical protein
VGELRSERKAFVSKFAQGVKWIIELCEIPFISSDPKGPARGSFAAERTGSAGADSVRG